MGASMCSRSFTPQLKNDGLDTLGDVASCLTNRVAAGSAAG